EVEIIVTPSGKRDNWVWKNIKKPDLHTGDNLRGDVTNPKKYKIKTNHYTNYQLNKNELVAYHQNPHLAYWMRYIRLQCPYEDKIFQRVWLDQTNINLPVLALACFELPNDRPIAFTYRDCHIWHALYNELIDNKTYRLDSSRYMYQTPNKYFYEYTSFVEKENAIIVDLGGSGRRPLNFFGGPKKAPEIIYLIRNKKATHAYIKTIITAWPGSSIEKHNCFDEGTIIDWNEHGPVRKENDHPPILVETQMAAKKIAVESIKHFKLFKHTTFLKKLIDQYKPDNFTHKNFEWEGNHQK
ncbi:MAG TPA: hypothetical protein VLB82_03355, partial [Thermodesulfobacteriota bacterium]|nr:hypothetical protein [Thermodesulfobacteriota bacterium]